MSNIKTGRQYWLKKLEGELPLLHLPLDRSRTSNKPCRSKREQVVIGKKLMDDLKVFAKENNFSVFTLLLGFYYVLLYYITNQEDILLGVSDVKLNKESFLISRQKLNNKEILIDFFQNIESELLHIHKNKKYFYEGTSKELNRDNFLNCSSIIRTAFINNLGKEDKVISEKCIDDCSDNLDIKMIIQKTKDDKTILFCDYNSNIFNSGFIDRFLGYYKNLLNDLYETKNKKLSKIGVLSKKEKDILINKFNNTYYSFPRDKTIQELFETQAKKIPNKIAIEFKDQKLTYGKLNKKADTLASKLREEGVRSEVVVSILAERNINLVIGVLAVLKAGGACLLLNSEYPIIKIKSIIQNSRSKIVLATKDVSGLSKDLKMINFSKKIKTNTRILKNINISKDSAFVVSTSGSTGKSKYVTLSHSGIVNNLFHRVKIANINSSSVTCLSSLMEFVAMPHHILLPILFGAKLVIYPQNIIKDPYLLFENINNDRITAVEVSVSSLLRYVDIIKQDKNDIPLKYLQTLWLSGAKMNNHSLNIFMKTYKKLKCIIVYGCSEYSMVLNNKVSEYIERIVEGGPSLNTQFYVLNKNKNIMPYGVLGDVYVSGEGMSKGYLYNSKKNKEVFLPHPFKNGKKMYKTGDLAKRYEDGSIEILGRADHQINLRGYRLEPGEIENSIRKYIDIKDAVVLKYNGNLMAFYSTKNKKPIKIKKLEDYLKKLLPQYMIPALFVYLKEMPINKNGKLDRLGMEKYKTRSNKKNKYEKPDNLVEEGVLVIWQNVLKTKKISRRDNFFNLGGHSLSAIEMLHQVNLEFKINISLDDIFNNLELFKLSKVIEERILEGQINPVAA